MPDGHAVKKGDMVNYQPYPMGRMKFLWGDDAEEFKPERWLDDSGMFVAESPFKFTAFQVNSASSVLRTAVLPLASNSIQHHSFIYV